MHSRGYIFFFSEFSHQLRYWLKKKILPKSKKGSKHLGMKGKKKVSENSPKTRTDTSPLLEPGFMFYDFMISCVLDESKTLALSLCSLLSQRGFTVWLNDGRQRGKSVVEKMALALQNSFIVIVCVGESYHLSGFCRLECEYAATMKKQIIPINCSPNFKIQGWIETIISPLGKLLQNVSGNGGFSFLL